MSGIKEVGVRLKYSEQGREKAQAGADKLLGPQGPLNKGSKDAGRAFTALDKAAGRAAQQTAVLASGVKKLNDLFKNLGDVQSVAELKRQLQETTREVERLTKARQKDEEQATRSANRRGFATGVLQGSGVGEFFPERGLRANVAGRMVGRGMAGAAHTGMAALSTPFTGMAGFQQAMGGIPLVGGFLAGQMASAQGYAGKALAAQQQMLGMAQFRGVGSGSAVARAGAAAAAGVPLAELNPAAVDLAGEVAARDAAALRDGTSGMPAGDARVRARGRAKLAAARRGGLNAVAAVGEAYTAEGGFPLEDPEVARARAMEAEQLAQHADRYKSAEARDAARRAAEDAARAAPFEFMVSEGQRYGLDPTAARGAGGEFLGAMGSRMDVLSTQRGRGLFSAALAGQVEGVDVGSAAAFGRAERTGAAVGGAPAAKAFEDAVRQGVRLGFSGADLNRYMAEIAGHLREFEQTGMRLDEHAMAGLQTGLAGTLGGTRAANVSQGLLSAARGVATSGASSPAELLMLQELGGFRGGGIDSFFDAQQRLETGKFASGGFEGLINRAKIFGSDKGNAIGIQDMLGQLGVRIGTDEALALAGGDPRAVSRWKKELAMQSKQAGEFRLADSAQAVPSEVARSATMEGKAEAAGLPMLEAVQRLNSASLETATNFAKFSEYIVAATRAIEEASVKAGPLVDELKAYAQDVLSRRGRE